MFYAPELLSMKNKTELSLLYYISTTKGYKQIGKKQVVNVDFTRIIQEMEHPEVPFSLRLYSFLLSGLVRVWIIKMDFYQKEIKLSEVERVKKTRTISRRPLNPNLQLEYDYIDHVSDIESSENVSISKRTMSDFKGMETVYNNDDGFSNEMEDLRRSNTGSIINSILPRIKKTKIDGKLLLKQKDLFCIKLVSKENKIPDLLDCFIVNSFRRIIESNRIEICDNAIDFDDNFSIEDPRVSNSTVSTERNESVLFMHKEKPNKAEWFYDLLVRAASGIIQVEQEYPFAKIQVFEDL